MSKVGGRLPYRFYKARALIINTDGTSHRQWYFGPIIKTYFNPHSTRILAERELEKMRSNDSLMKSQNFRRFLKNHDPKAADAKDDIEEIEDEM